MNIKYKFPENFWWGSATSGPQCEGASNIDGKGKSIWDYWYEKEPNRFQMLKQTHPKQYDYIINKLGMGKVLDFIKVKY